MTGDTFESAAHGAALKLSRSDQHYENPLHTIEEALSELRWASAKTPPPVASSFLSRVYAVIGVAALDLYIAQTADEVQSGRRGRHHQRRYVADDVANTVAHKQHDYGHDNITNFGHMGICIRLFDKLARVKNLTTRGSTALNESLTDSYLDLVGYSIVGLMLANGTFLLPLAGDITPKEAV